MPRWTLTAPQSTAPTFATNGIGGRISFDLSAPGFRTELLDPAYTLSMP